MLRAKKAATKRRATIGENPLDSLFTGSTKAATKASRRGLAPAGTTPRPEAPPKSKKPPKVRATFHLPADLFEECRDAVVALSGPPVRLTLATLAEDALHRELGRLKKEHNRGKSFPKRDEPLRGGRPIGS